MGRQNGPVWLGLLSKNGPKNTLTCLKGGLAGQNGGLTRLWPTKIIIIINKKKIFILKKKGLKGPTCPVFRSTRFDSSLCGPKRVVT